MSQGASSPSAPLSGWRRWAVALVLGAVSALALPPLYLVPALWPGLAGLAYLGFSARSGRQAAFEGWLFGLGWFGVGLYWIGYAFLVDAETFAAMMPFAVAAISAGMAIYIALTTLSVNLLVRRAGVDRITLVPVFAACWTLAEWVRGWFLTGFPWNPLASVWGVSPEMMQPAAWVGALGLSFITALVFAAPAALFGRDPDDQRPLVLALGLSLMLPALWAGGWSRLAGGGTMTHDGIVLRLIQPAIPQDQKWRDDLRRQHVIRQMAMSKRTPGPAGAPTHVIWAETNVPYAIGPDSEIPATLAAAVPAGGALIFGAPRIDAERRAYNALMAINDDGRLQATFDKFHLVPFGEYLPMRGILPFDKLVPGRGDFHAGPGPVTLQLDGVPPFSPLICYEIIFAGQVVDVDNRPGWIVNITNDAWFGPSSGPHQHLVQAQLRAVEEGLPVVRVANTGITAVIDPFGRVRNRLELGVQGVVDAPLPEALAPTPFAVLGQWVGVVLALAGLAAGLHRMIAVHVFGRITE